MLRNVGATVLGGFVGGVANMAMILVASFVLWPAPEGTDFNDPVQMQAYVATLPVIALLWVIGAHLAQAGLGGWVAARLGTKPLVLALIVGALSSVGGVLNLLNLAAPVWMWIELPLYFVISGAIGWVEQQR